MTGIQTPPLHPTLSTALPAPTAESAMPNRRVRQQVAQAVLDGYCAAGELDVPTELREPAEAAVRVLLRDETERGLHTDFMSDLRSRAGVGEALERSERGVRIPEETLWNEGPSALSGEQLAALLVCPTTLEDVGGQLDDLDAAGQLPDRWNPSTDVTSASLPESDVRPTAPGLSPTDRETIRDVVALAVNHGSRVPDLSTDFRDRLTVTVTAALASEPVRIEYQQTLRQEFLAQSGRAWEHFSGPTADIDVDTLTARGPSALSTESLYAVAIDLTGLAAAASFVAEKVANGSAGSMWTATPSTRPTH